MEDKPSVEQSQRAESERTREPYVTPELKLLGDVRELTRGSSGSTADSLGFAQKSSVKFKKDVEYLDETQRKAVADQAMALRLARWDYVEPSLAGHRHLGIIIEDNPDVAAVDLSRESVNVYSYASMAIAAAQEQSKELRQLRAEIESLRSEIATLRGRTS